MPTLRRLVCSIVYLASCVVPQAALGDCAHEIVDQAYQGSITRHYSQDCYNAAIRIEPVDGSSYSDLDQIIKDAKRADALRVAISASNAATSPAASNAEQRTPPPSPAAVRAGGGRSRPGQAVRRPTASPSTEVDVTLLGAPSARPVLERLAPAHAGDVPLAVIALGLFATLLVLAGLAGAIARRRARRRPW